MLLEQISAKPVRKLACLVLLFSCDFVKSKTMSKSFLSVFFPLENITRKVKKEVTYFDAVHLGGDSLRVLDNDGNL